MRLIICNLFCCLFALGAAAQESSTKDSLIVKAESSIIAQTNDFRRKNDLPAVSREQNLTTTATKFAQFMAKEGKYGHQADGQTPAQRAKTSGYEYCVVRENIAYRSNSGEVTADSLVEVFVTGWIDSPSHRENMLADYVTETGVGVATSDGVTYYAVQLFGRPKSAAFRIKVTNQSDQVKTVVVRANDSEDEFELPPRGIVRMERCFPTTISTNSGDQTFTVDEAGQFLINDDGLQEDQQ